MRQSEIVEGTQHHEHRNMHRTKVCTSLRASGRERPNFKTSFASLGSTPPAPELLVWLRIFVHQTRSRDLFAHSDDRDHSFRSIATTFYD